MMPLDEQTLRRLAELEDQCESISAGNPMYWDECRAVNTIRQQQDEIQRLRAEVERLQAELREHCDLAKSSNAEHADVEAAWRAEVERLREEVAMYRSALANALGIPQPAPPVKEE